MPFYPTQTKQNKQTSIGQKKQTNRRKKIQRREKTQEIQVCTDRNPIKNKTKNNTEAIMYIHRKCKVLKTKQNKNLTEHYEIKYFQRCHTVCLVLAIYCWALGCVPSGTLSDGTDFFICKWFIISWT